MLYSLEYSRYSDELVSSDALDLVVVLSCRYCYVLLRGMTWEERGARRTLALRELQLINTPNVRNRQYCLRVIK
jgi:hypothetical protein